MRAPYTQLYVHVVWATWDRLPLLTPALEPRVHAAIVEKCQALKAYPLAVGGMPDHVHLLARLPSALSVAELVMGVKGVSSHLVTQVIAPNEFFKWQGAYGAFSVGQDGINRCIDYIRGQKSHHAEGDLYSDWEISASDPATSTESDPPNPAA